MVPNSPAKVDFLGAKHLAYHAAVMMTTATSFEINTHISPSDAFCICLNARKRNLRSFDADSGDQLKALIEEIQQHLALAPASAGRPKLTIFDKGQYNKIPQSPD
jgi:hypothetical protein